MKSLIGAGFRRFCALTFLLAGAAGCLPQLPQNAKSSAPPQRTIIWQSETARLESEIGVDDALWLEVNHSSEDAAVGGYLSQNAVTQNALILLLHGASTFQPGGSPGAALNFHDLVGGPLQERGYLTWSLVTHECGTAYGTGDLADVIDAVDWLYREGKMMFDVDRVYVLGYSTGATLAMLLNRNRQVDAVVEISGLAQPDTIENRIDFWRWITALYPHNIGACQMLSTLTHYGPAGSPAWDALDTVAHIHELKSPMLVIHGDRDTIFETSNAYNLLARYDEVIAAGDSIPEMEFLFVPGADHFLSVHDPGVLDAILAFLQRH